MNAIIAECVRHILRHPDKGMGNSELAQWCASYRALEREDRVNVQIALVKVPELAVLIGAYGAAKFYAKTHAPDGAFSFSPRQQEGEIIARAMERT